MIVFDLRCDGGHVFEAWFQSSAAYETQRSAGHVVCPMCGTTGVGKAVMAPELAESMQAEAIIPVGSTPDQFGTFIKSEMAKWGKVIRDRKITIDGGN